MKSSNDEIPLIADLVLVGGGHAHVHILKMAGMEPLKSTLSSNGIQITLISSTTLTPYSGMLPGYIAGHYTSDEIHLDLRKLCSFGNVRFIHASAIGITHENEEEENHLQGGKGFVKLSDGRPHVRYDTLSIDVGSSPSLPQDFLSQNVKGHENDLDANVNAKTTPPLHSTRSSITPVKPIATFSKRWENICARLESAPINAYTPSNPFQLIVVGGGAGGLELALSAQYSLQNILESKLKSATTNTNATTAKECIQISLVTRGNHILSSHNTTVRSIFKRILSEKKIQVCYNAEVIGITKHQYQHSTSTNLEQLKLSSTSKHTDPIFFHECLFCTSANASSWLSTETPFDTIDGGFIKVNDTYECVNHSGVFAVGDCCHFVDDPRPKAGVFAVRAGPIVKENLVAFLLNRPLTHHKPQNEFLGLISTGEKYAVASRGDHALEGQCLWTLKDEIDRTWMDGYKTLPDMSGNDNDDTDTDDDNDEKDEQASSIPSSLLHRGQDALAAFAEINMRCGGCGAKVGSTTLTRVLDAVHTRRALRNGGSSYKVHKIDPDDAAIVMIPKGAEGGAMIHTIDFFRSFISDPYTFGKIAAVHALSDVHAMGAETSNVLALAVVPYAANESMTEYTLIDMLSGASDVMDEEGCELIGGHTCEGKELSLGFSVNGFISDPKLLLRKQGGTVGDKIIITKPLGTGALFAADMRAKCYGLHVEEAIASMTMSNRVSSKAAMKFVRADKRESVHSATDVTGFGLIGHLLEMLVANDEAKDGDGQPLDKIAATLYVDQIPFLRGGEAAVKDGIVSSLYRENFRSRRSIANHEEALEHFPIKYPLLFDPQTAGGLLFFVSPSICDEFMMCLTDEYGVSSSAVIGEITQYNNDAASINICDVANVCTLSQTKNRILIQ